MASWERIRAVALAALLSNLFGERYPPMALNPGSSGPGAAAARLAAGIPLTAAGAMGRAPRRRARAWAPCNAAVLPFLADSVRAAGGGR